MKTATFSIDAGAILKEIEQHFSNNGDNTVPGIVMACQILRVELHAIGTRAVELGDEQLQTRLSRIGVLQSA